VNSRIGERGAFTRRFLIRFNSLQSAQSAVNFPQPRAALRSVFSLMKSVLVFVSKRRPENCQEQDNQANQMDRRERDQ